MQLTDYKKIASIQLFFIYTRIRLRRIACGGRR